MLQWFFYSLSHALSLSPLVLLLCSFFCFPFWANDSSLAFSCKRMWTNTICQIILLITQTSISNAHFDEECVMIWSCDLRQWSSFQAIFKSRNSVSTATKNINIDCVDWISWDGSRKWNDIIFRYVCRRLNCHKFGVHLNVSLYVSYSIFFTSLLFRIVNSRWVGERWAECSHDVVS